MSSGSIENCGFSQSWSLIRAKTSRSAEQEKRKYKQLRHRDWRGRQVSEKRKIPTWDSQLSRLGNCGSTRQNACNWSRQRSPINLWQMKTDENGKTTGGVSWTVAVCFLRWQSQGWLCVAWASRVPGHRWWLGARTGCAPTTSRTTSCSRKRARICARTSGRARFHRRVPRWIDTPRLFGQPNDDCCSMIPLDSASSIGAFHDSYSQKTGNKCRCDENIVSLFWISSTWSLNLCSLG